MVKASLRAMDTITEFCKQKYPEMNTQLDYYSVAGASKRGWTTWDVGAVDGGRVKAIIPVVLDAINFVDVEHHQYQAYGGKFSVENFFIFFCVIFNDFNSRHFTFFHIIIEKYLLYAVFNDF